MVERILLLLKIKNLTPSKFADEVGIQRSGMSHIISGRNQPSLDLILKILNTFPDISADWLLHGKGQMIKSQFDLFGGNPLESKVVMEEKPQVLFPENSLFEDNITEEDKKEYLEEIKLMENKAEMPDNRVNDDILSSPKNIAQETTVEKIVIFYTDGTFKAYNPVDKTLHF